MASKAMRSHMTNIIGLVIWIWLLELMTNPVNANSEFECISTAMCNLLRGDIEKEFNMSPTKYYNRAHIEMTKFIHFKGCGITKINEKCADRFEMCKIELRMRAKDRYGTKGLRPGILSDCSIGTWSFLLMLCKNMDGWPKTATKDIPKEYMTCNSSCPMIEEFEAFHKRQKRVDSDFPPFWKDKIALMADYLNSSKYLLTDNPFEKSESDPTKTTEIRQFGGPVTTNRTDLVQTLSFGNEFLEGAELTPYYCPPDTWIVSIFEDLPDSVYYKCSTFEGKLNPPGDVYYWFPGVRSNKPTALIKSSEKLNLKTDLSRTRLVQCDKNKFKKYHPDHSFLLGMQFRTGSNKYLHSGKYLCAGDNIWTDWTKDEEKNEFFDLTASRRCPMHSAACNIAGSIRPDRMIVKLQIGCCTVPMQFIESVQIFETIPYSSGNNLGNGTGLYLNVFSRFVHRYPYQGQLENERQTFLCPPNSFIDKFRTDLIIPQGPAEDRLCGANNIRSQNDPSHLFSNCREAVYYLFITRLFCNRLDKTTSVPLKGLTEYLDSIPIDRTIGIGGERICTNGFFSSGVFEVEGQTLNKRLNCTSDSTPLGKYETGSYTFPFAEMKGGWGFTRGIRLDFAFTPGSWTPSLSPFKVEFKCPEGTALCGVGGIRGLTTVRDRPSTGKVSGVLASVEGMYYDHLCCPMDIEYCPESAFKVVLERIPAICSIPSGSRGVCFVTSVNERISMIGNMTIDTNKTTGVTSFGVNVTAAAKYGFGVASLGGMYGSVREKVKMYGFERSFQERTLESTVSTANFSIDEGRSLLAYQPFIYCGRFKVSSNRIVAIQTPSTDCDPTDDLALFEVIDATESVAKDVTVNFIGHGTQFTEGRAADQVDIPWNDIRTNIVKKFKDNARLAFSVKTRYRWGRAPLETYDEYKYEVLNFTYTIQPGKSYEFYRVIGTCSRLWIVQPKVTLQNVIVKMNDLKPGK